MKHDEQNCRRLDSAVGVIRALVQMLQIMQRREVTKDSTKLGGTEQRTQSTFTIKWRAETMRQH